jgi:hypothetical protein
LYFIETHIIIINNCKFLSILSSPHNKVRFKENEKRREYKKPSSFPPLNPPPERAGQGEMEGSVIVLGFLFDPSACKGF